MAVSSSEFISDIIIFLRSALRDNIQHPEGKSTQFIFTSFPKTNTTYPIITIKVGNLLTKALGMYSEVSLATLSIELRVWAKDSKQCDNMTQEIIDLLRTLQYGANSTTDEEIFGFRLNSCVPIVESDGDMTIHSKVLEFNYQCVLGDA